MILTPSLWAACIWFIVAAIMTLIPSNDHLWRRAYVLIAFGIPLLGWITYENGPWVGLLILAAGSSFLRWPLIYLYRWLKSQISG